MKRTLWLILIAIALSIPVMAGEIGTPGYVPPPTNPLVAVVLTLVQIVY